MSRVETYRKTPIPKRWIISGLILAIAMITSAILLLLYPFASKEKNHYFTGENPILYQNKQHGNALIIRDAVFIPIDFIKDNLDDSIIFDESSQSIILTTKNKVVQMPTESLTYYVNEKPVKLHVPTTQTSNGELYVAVEPLLSYYPIQYEILTETNAVWVQQNGDELVHAKVSEKEVHPEKLRLRVNPTLRSPYLAVVIEGEKLFYEGEKEKYYLVRKENGIRGYLQKELVDKGKSEKISIIREEKSVVLKKIDGPIKLTWEAVYNRNPDPTKLPKMPGINVVSPTWFELENSDGNIKNLGSLDYVKWAHKREYQVWALFSNAFDPELTHLAFKNYETRQKMIRELLHYSQMYHLDGINFDIENVNLEDGPFITQFMREATPLLHEAGLTVSMDITFISSSSNWSAFYEREKLGTIVDYLMVMAYDEHWGSSPIAGSVASLPWVEENMEELLKIVPHEKLILGVPLYTRLWKEEILTDGQTKVSSKAFSMTKIKEWLVENKLKPSYDHLSGQNYAEVFLKEENATYRVWLEDELSLKKRADLVLKYELAGVASWSRFFADDTAWVALHSNKSFTKADKK
ncbi:glycosyl hydrolase family 18 protein [Neobacillus sp. D3-1R]|uniref:glycosyl hydrolase family 18 protein n=1 Tax=Neobacillus sp. D3-1R TaxID=3445778 RepID=UPI003FA043C4